MDVKAPGEAGDRKGTAGAAALQDLQLVDAWWRAANYLSVGQIYLLANPLLREKLQPEHIKPRLLGHWGTTPGLNFIYAHLNRVIRANNLDVLLVIGPGHGGPALVANTWLEGSYTERYPDISLDEPGMGRLFRQFSFPGGIPSHCAPDIPGSIHEGGELGYSLAHAYGAAYDNPNLLVACVVGDGEAETGPLATSWHSNKFHNPVTDGAVLPILHLNGYKIASATVLARIPKRELTQLMLGYGFRPIFVEGKDPRVMHQRMSHALDHAIAEIRSIQSVTRASPDFDRPHWPMIVLRSPKGWTGPKKVDGQPVEGTWRAHQVPLSEVRENAQHRRMLESWMRSYKAEELFTENGAPRPELLQLSPPGRKRMGSTPYANGGELLRELKLPNAAAYAVDVSRPGAVDASATRVLGAYLRDVFRLTERERHFRLFGPDETESNRLTPVLEATARTWMAIRERTDEHLAPDGRVMEILSEHACQGWLEGYVLTGRHGLFSCYEAFIHIIDSMFNQHAKWLKASREIRWRAPIAALNILLTSHVWRQDHNGFTHQDPGFLDVVTNKAEIVNIYLAPDANTLLCVADRCLRARDVVNVIVAGKNPQAQWLDMSAAARHCEKGIGVFEWASTDEGRDPDVVLGCCGDVPTLETLAATDILRRELPDLRVRVVNVVDLMTLQPSEEHPHGLTSEEFDELFTRDKKILFAFHAYPMLIHRLAYRRTNHGNLHVRGYKERGTTTTPFDMVVLNDLDRFHLVLDVIRRVPGLADRAGDLRERMQRKLEEHRAYIREHGDDMPEVKDWRWQGR
jgi:xylulose-5-phosphate/fructose-6-phosphate phosphoketolase